VTVWVAPEQPIEVGCMPSHARKRRAPRQRRLTAWSTPWQRCRWSV